MSTPDPLLDLLAELETLTVPQRAMVMATAIGACAGMFGAASGCTMDSAVTKVMDMMKARADEVKLLYPVN